MSTPTVPEGKKEHEKAEKHKEVPENTEKRAEKKDVEEKREAERKTEIKKENKNKDAQNDRQKRAENEDLDEKIDGERKKENVTGKKNKATTRDNVEVKRDGRGLEDPHDISRKEECYSCSSRCSISQLEDMIKDLPNKTILSRSGNYIVYKHKLKDGSRVDLCRIGQLVTVTVENDFRVRDTAKLQHINILELLGYFYHGGFLYRVEEYLGGTLYSRIFDNSSKAKELSWKEFSKIILDIADGVAYMHESGVIHMSLHPKMIFIGPKCTPKICHFNISEILTGSIQEGVLAPKKMKREIAPPEYHRHGRFSVKTDVYSYGVLLLELITGQKCNLDDRNYNSLTASVWQSRLDNKLIERIQPRLFDDPDCPEIEDIKRCICIALLCVEEDPALRPTMGVVGGWLRNQHLALPRICKPAYVTKETVTDTPPTTMSTPPKLPRGERVAGPTDGMIEPKTVQEGSAVRK